MKSLATLDVIVIVVYLLAIAGIGSSFYRRKSSAREYFLGGKSMSWLPVGISIIAADLSAITVMGSPAWAFSHNLELTWTAIGYPLVAPLVIYLFVPFYSRLNLYTAYEYLERRFDVKVRVFTSLLFQLLRGLHVAVVIYAPSLVIHLITGLPGWECIFLMGAFTTVYTTLGGVKAVIWTDVIQFTAVSAGILVILVMALVRVPGGIPAAWHVAETAGKLHLLNWSTSPSELTSLWACLLGGLVLCMGPLTTDQAVLQRLFTTKSSQDCRQSIVVQALLIVPLSVILSLVGVALFAFYHYHPKRLAGLPLADAIVPFFAVQELPSGLSGLVIASLFSASLAVMSAGINSLTTATTIDFYQRLFRPHEASTHYSRVGRMGTLLWGTAVTLLALYADRLGELALAYNKVSSVITGPMLGIFLLATLTRRATAMGALSGAFVGGVVVWLVSFTTSWSFFLYGPIGVAMTFLAGYAASLATAPPAEENIRGLVVGYGDPGSIVVSDQSNTVKT